MSKGFYCKECGVWTYNHNIHVKGVQIIGNFCSLRCAAQVGMKYAIAGYRSKAFKEVMAKPHRQ